MSEVEATNDVAALTVQLLSAYLANNTVASEDLAGLIRSTREALTDDGSTEATAEPETFVPAVSVRKSLASPEHIISLIDGRPYKTLKRHLMSHGLTPDLYRSRYNLPANYPMVAPAYADRRREVAQQLGLGRRKPEAAKGTDNGTASDGSAETPSLNPPAETEAPVTTAAGEQGEASPKSANDVKPAPKKRTSSPARAKATASKAGDPKAKSADAAGIQDDSATASAGNAPDEPATATEEKPKRRARLGVFKKTDTQKTGSTSDTDTQAADAQTDDQASASKSAARKAPAKRKSTKRMARASGSSQDA